MSHSTLRGSGCEGITEVVKWAFAALDYSGKPSIFLNRATQYWYTGYTRQHAIVVYPRYRVYELVWTDLHGNFPQKDSNHTNHYSFDLRQSAALEQLYGCVVAARKWAFPG